MNVNTPDEITKNFVEQLDTFIKHIYQNQNPKPVTLDIPLVCLDSLKEEKFAALRNILSSTENAVHVNLFGKCTNKARFNELLTALQNNSHVTFTDLSQINQKFETKQFGQHSLKIMPPPVNIISDNRKIDPTTQANCKLR